MSESLKGVLAMVAACVIWGLSPLFYKLLEHVPPLEILAHRTLWSFLIFGALLLLQGRLGALLRALRSWRVLLLVGLAAGMISLNWFFFILSIQVGRTVEASLGYYIFPLVAVILGRLFFGEALDRVQWLAVALTALAVSVLTAGLGAAPWIALLLGFSFGLYGVVKKALEMGPIMSVTGEVLLLLPLALLWLWGVNMQGWVGVTGRPGGHFGESWGDSLLLAFSGAMTAGPLILFSHAARRLNYASVGLIQYLNPSLQFAVAVLVFREFFSLWHGIAFALIWLALGLYSARALALERSRSRRAASSGRDVITHM